MKGDRVFNVREALLGGVIQSIIPMPDSEGGVILIVSVDGKSKRGKFQSKVYHVETWRDPEGNGPGHLYVEEA